MLAMTAVIFLASASLALGLGGDKPAEEMTPQSTEEQGRGGCCRGNQAAGACEPGALSWGRGARQDPYGMRHGEGRGPGMRHRWAGRSGGRWAINQDLMEATRALVHDYRQDVVREVEDIENGVVTITRIAENLEAVAVLR